MSQRIFILLWTFLIRTVFVFSQSVPAPNCALRSHETLQIQKIVLSSDKTEVFLRVGNRISGGTFCADRKIFIVYPDGTKSMLVTSDGIPVCPDAHKFRSPGEYLDFVLTFHPLKKGTVSVNLIEDCQENCFSFYGIILDNQLNKNIDEGFTQVETDEPAKALVTFIRLAEETGRTNPGAEGLLYLNIVQLAKETGNEVRAAEWYRKLESSGLPETALYLKHLNSLGIKF